MKGEIECFAKHCYYPIQIDPNVTLNSAPVSSPLLIINSIVLSSNPESQQDKKSWCADAGFQLPSPELDTNSPIYLSQISVGNRKADDRKFVEPILAYSDDFLSNLIFF